MRNEVPLVQHVQGNFAHVAVYRGPVWQLVGVLSDVNLHFIVQTYPLARMKFMTIQYI